MWPALRAVSSVERFTLLRVSFIERFHCSLQYMSILFTVL